MNLRDYFFETANEKDIVTILDIGSSKIVCLIVNTAGNKIEVLGTGCHSANGFKNSGINDLKLAKISIISAIEQAEKTAGLVIEKVILVLNGNKVRSHYLKTFINLKKKKITEYDVENLIYNGIKELENQNYEVIHYSPLEYKVDDSMGVKDPCSLIGSKLAAEIHFVTVPAILLENIINCLADCQINIEDCIFAPHASGLSVLSANERAIGATVIDFGDGITSYALFSQNNMVNCGYIPIGGRAITNDIAKGFMLDLSNAERIKTIHGSASASYIDNQKMIKTKDNSLTGLLETEERSISVAELNEVINARIEEIFSLLKDVLTNQYKTFPNAKVNIILTGGCSMLTGVADEISRIFGAKVRVNKPFVVNGLKQEFMSGSYASAIGVINYLSDNNMKTQDLKNNSLFQKIIKWIRSNF